MGKNANANASGLASGASVFLVYLLHHYAGVNLSLYYSGLIVGAVSYLALFIGRDGFKGLFSRLWNGSKKVWGGSTSAPAPPAA